MSAWTQHNTQTPKLQEMGHKANNHESWTSPLANLDDDDYTMWMCELPFSNFTTLVSRSFVQSVGEKTAEDVFYMKKICIVFNNEFPNWTWQRRH